MLKEDSQLPVLDYLVVRILMSRFEARGNENDKNIKSIEMVKDYIIFAYYPTVESVPAKEYVFD